MRTVFALLPVGQRFRFIGNPIVWGKISDFTAVIVDSPYATYDEPAQESDAIENFSTDAIVDTLEA